MRKERNFEYPFGKRWVYSSVIMSIISIVFGVFMLSEEGFIALLLYFGFVSLLTLAVLALKFYIYSHGKQEMSEEYSYVDEMESEMKGKAPKRRWRWSLIIVICLTILALFTPLILLMILEPLWWLICIVSYVPAVNIPEIILYIYSQRLKS